MNKATSKTKQISVVIPTLNEVDSVGILVERLHKTLSTHKIDYELVFIDDNSVDKTLNKLQTMALTYPQIRVESKVGKQGKAQSLLQGFTLAQAEVVVMIDADLQYPPEVIPEMLAKINGGFDIVVAARSKKNLPFIRKFLSRGFEFVFGKLLHQFDFDVQSGLKMFRRKILDEVELKPSPWTIDLELLTKARNAGYKITNINIVFEERLHGESKIKPEAIFQIGWHALRTKFAKTKPLIIPAKTHKSMIGAGLAFNRKRFVTHTTLPHEISAIQTFVPWQKVLFFSVLFLVILSFVFNPLLSAIIIVSVLSVIYFLDVIFNFYMVVKSLHGSPEITFTTEELTSLNNKDLPIYSILCPLFREAHILPGFLEAIERLDWPKEKLDVMLLLEESDKVTIDAAENLDLPDYVRIVIVPESLPQTKPKACNYGLSLARGEYLVIYDAEDLPAVDQLKKAYLGFQKVGSRVRCLQAKLNYNNPQQNLLTRFFTAEYSLWFDVILPGLQSINGYIPLGGTSNHFHTSDLLGLKGWDPFNVTEDCDLGARLFKAGFTTAVIDSVTYEEANSNVKNWIRQRSRWIKGYMQTYLVHMRNPLKFFRESGIHAVVFQLVVGGKIAFLLINPFLWLTTIAYFVLRPIVGPTIEHLYPPVIFYIAVASLLFGNFMYLYYYMIGCAKRGHWGVIKYIYLVPIYWFMASVAAVMALYQLIVKPHFWEKTNHGLALIQSKAPRVSYFTFIKRGFLDFKGLFEKLPKVKKTKLGQKNILIYNWRDTKHTFSGGAEVYIHEMAKRWVKEGNSVTVFSGHDGRSPRSEIIDGVTIIRRGGFYFVYLWAVVYYFLQFRGKFDVIIDCQNGVPFFTPLYAKEQIFCLMHHVHQHVFTRSLSFLMASFARFLEKRLMPLVYRNIKFITISNSSKNDIEDLGLGRRGIYIVNPGVNLHELSLGEKSREPTVVYLGRLKAYKSVDVLIKAFFTVVSKTKNAKLIIAGSGEEEGNLRKLVSKMDLDGSVSFVGRISDKDKARILQRAWVFVNPSFMEGWGITTVEANACGTPIVAANVPGLRDSVLYPHTGFLVKHGDYAAFAEKILQIIEDEELRDQMGQDARVWAERFDWSKTSQDFLSVLDGAFINPEVYQKEKLDA